MQTTEKHERPNYKSENIGANRHKNLPKQMPRTVEHSPKYTKNKRTEKKKKKQKLSSAENNIACFHT